MFYFDWVCNRFIFLFGKLVIILLINLIFIGLFLMMRMDFFFLWNCSIRKLYCIMKFNLLKYNLIVNEIYIYVWLSDWLFIIFVKFDVFCFSVRFGVGVIGSDDKEIEWNMFIGISNNFWLCWWGIWMDYILGCVLYNVSCF